jgi:RimJ/RimL family protein N-acetyltransferase
MIDPVELEGRIVRLEPLREEHVAGLTAAGRDESIWRWMPYGTITGEAAMGRFVADMLKKRAQGTDLPFTVVERTSGSVVGNTRYLDIQMQNRALEIGGTWYAVTHQRTGVNTECKLLLLRHAFETLECLRVQFKTDLRNERSQRALERIGAVREGTLRKQVTLPDGYQRSSVYYSVIDEEWPGVRERLEGFLERS